MVVSDGGNGNGNGGGELGHVGSTHCPLCGEKYKAARAARKRWQINHAKELAAKENAAAVPRELASLELYAADVKLCALWPQLLPAWRQAFPGVDVLLEVRRAHAWEVSNPQRRKVVRSRFLRNWLSKQSDRPKVPWTKDGLAVAQEGDSRASERELLLTRILDGKDGSRAGKTIPWKGRAYEVLPQGLRYGGDTRILPWMRLTTEDLEEILRRVELYEHASEVW